MNIRRTGVLLGVLTIAPALQAGFVNIDQFLVTGVYLDDSNIPARGTGIFFDAEAYQTPFGTNFPPRPIDILEIPETEFDSYVAFGGTPADVMTSGIAPPMTPDGFDDATGFFEQPGTIGGALFASEVPGASQVNPASGRESFFFARLTLPAGTMPGGSVGFDIIGEEGTRFAPVEIVDPDLPGDVTFRGFREFKVVAQRTERDRELPIFADGRGNTALFDVYDFYIELVPAPGAAFTFFGAGAFALVRRRR
ncbi:MAG: hypothetical protein Tsb0013_03930 [Phycisphaerales bacterium]